jgi:hypothetical protein
LSAHQILDIIQAIVYLALTEHSKGIETKMRTHPEEWPCTKFCRIGLDDDSVENFLLWLCDRSNEPIDQHMSASRRDRESWVDPVEYTWGWDAPRRRMAKLLWKMLHGNASEEVFRNEFSYSNHPLQVKGCDSLLAPIQKRLRWVMEGFSSRQEQDSEIGQGDWGEEWWLPAEQAEFVRNQLRQSCVDLIERSSDYDDTVIYSLCFYVRDVVQAIAVPCDDPARVYVGARRGPHLRVFVWVQSENGRKYPLKHGNQAYLKADGTGFEWGYGGGGPGELAHCILADALDGDLVMATELEHEFYTEFTMNYPRWKEFRMSRVDVLRWLEKTGAKAKWEGRRQSVADRCAKHAAELADKEALLARIMKIGGLRSQRFDLVPTTFESALYLDLMRMLERSAFALRCSGCGLPIPYDNSGRANRQRARAKKGQPIYHPECFADYSRTRKKIDWQRRSRIPEFREQERQRARDYRKLT